MAEDMDLPTRDETRLTKLGSTLRAAYSANDQARRPVEEQWLKNVRQYIGGAVNHDQDGHSGRSVCKPRQANRVKGPGATHPIQRSDPAIRQVS